MKAKVVLFLALMILPIAGLLIAGFVVLPFIENYALRRDSPIKQVTLIQDLQVDQDWKEVNLRMVETPQKEVNSVLVYANLPVSRDGFESLDGGTFYPEVILEDQEGKKCRLKFNGSTRLALSFSGEETDGIDQACFSNPSAYKSLRIKSPVEFEAKRITWEGYDLADRK